MHITCVICSDLFTPCADIYSTPCGHIFHYTCLLHWLENSKTCPQCRAKCSSKALVRLFVNIATSQGLEADVTILQHKLDSVDFNMKLKNQEIKNLSLKNKETQEQNKLLRDQIKKLELSEKRYESVVAATKEQIKYFKGEAQNCSRLKAEVSNLQEQIKNFENIQTALTGSRQQVEDIVRNENSVESLALLAATLKKSLVDTDRRKKELHFELKKTKNELSQSKRAMAELKCEYEDTKKKLESLKLSYEKEVSFLKNKFSQLQAKMSNGIANESLNNSIMRITSESPVNYNRTPVLSGRQGDIIDLCDTPPTTSQSSTESAPETKKDEVDLDVAVLENIVEDSPLPASSMGMFAMQRSKMQGPQLAQNKFSIFKNKAPVPAKEVPISISSKRQLDVSYDGLGGSVKEDIFPTPGTSSSLRLKRPKTTKTSSSKFKKLSADAGKPNRKVSDFLNISG